MKKKKILIASTAMSLCFVITACSNNNSNITGNTVTFTGNYSDSTDFETNTFTSNGATLNLVKANPGTAKFTCPNGYIFLPFLSAPADGTTGGNATCNRQGGCEIYELEWATVATGFTAHNGIMPQGLTSALFDNYSGLGRLLATCVKQDQVNNWI